MKTRLIHSASGKRTFVAVLETGDAVKAALTRFAEAEGLSAAQITAIGAFERATIRYFDWDTRAYVPIPIDEQVEVASLNGDIALGEDGSPMLHIHVVLGRRDGSALAGDLDEGTVRPTLEVIVTESPDHLVRVHDPVTRLPLIRPGRS